MARSAALLSIPMPPSSGYRQSGGARRVLREILALKAIRGLLVWRRAGSGTGRGTGRSPGAAREPGASCRRGGSHGSEREVCGAGAPRAEGVRRRWAG